MHATPDDQIWNTARCGAMVAIWPVESKRTPGLKRPECLAPNASCRNQHGDPICCRTALSAMPRALSFTEESSCLLMEELVSLCKRRGFIFQSGDIYGGLQGMYDTARSASS